MIRCVLLKTVCELINNAIAAWVSQYSIWYSVHIDILLKHFYSNVKIAFNDYINIYNVNKI